MLRPGRLDRQIKIDNPNKQGIKEIFKIHTAQMKLEKIDKNKIHDKLQGMRGAEIRAVCTEAGYFAIRQNRNKIKQKDFLDGIKKLKEEEEREEHTGMFG